MDAITISLDNGANFRPLDTLSDAEVARVVADIHASARTHDDVWTAREHADGRAETEAEWVALVLAQLGRRDWVLG